MAHPSPIVSPESLLRDYARPDIRIVDVRWVLGAPGAGRAAYKAGHIPGAIFLDLDTDLAAPEGPGRHPLPTPAAFRERLEGAGIGDNDTVVAYDDTSGATAARLWWMLDDLGHDRVAILDGGYPAWVAAGYPVSTTAPQGRPRGRLTMRDAWTRVTDRETVAGGLGTIVLLDARAAPRYRGEVEPIDRVPGHIPTARSAPSASYLGPDGRLLDAGALAKQLATLGVNESSAAEVVTSCGSGVTACLTSLAMRVAGLPAPILYPGSYSDWSSAGLPIATGPEPGAPPGG